MLNCIVTESSSILVGLRAYSMPATPLLIRLWQSQSQGIIEIPDLLAVSVGEAKLLIDEQEEVVNRGREQILS
jgi:hypothetical protein